jgi:hypothetical protein
MTYELTVGTWIAIDLSSARRYCKATRATGLSATYTQHERTWTGRDGFAYACIEYLVEVTP